ncbi:hypothetical protein R1sor_007173 [Riccia sorocarpa]|uniref:Integrase catalytic domain-containing protein n=1 Tax=Riccia sorocarpa TaxID=122646 RepID=A0ABD3HT63_9MARC
MVNLEKLKFPPLELDGRNYTIWVTHVDNHLTADDLQHMIVSSFTLEGEGSADRAKHAARALVLILHHLSPSLQQQYLTEPQSMSHLRLTKWKPITQEGIHNGLLLIMTIVVMGVMLVEHNEDVVIGIHEVHEVDEEDTVVDVVLNLNEIIVNVHLRKNGFGVYAPPENSQFHLVRQSPSGWQLVETFHGNKNTLPSTTIRPVNAEKSSAFSTEAASRPSNFSLWHSRLGHPSISMLRHIVKTGCLQGLDVSIQELARGHKRPCVPCTIGKFNHQPYPQKPFRYIPAFLERIHADVCGPIDPAVASFRYFLVIVDSSPKRLLRTTLLSTRNLVFPRILHFLIEMRTHYPESLVRFLRVDCAAEFESALFTEFCLSSGITLETSVAHEHQQNGLAESHIKRL